MGSLNEPVGFDEHDPADDWTPAKGLARGAAVGLILSVLLAVATGFVAAWLPFLLLVFLARAGVALGVAWLLIRAVNNAAGMMSRPCLVIALVLTTLVLLSHHLVFAVHGVPALAGVVNSWWLFPMALVESLIGEQDGWTRGWGWFHPYVLLAVNGFPVLILIGMYAVYSRE